MKKYFLNRILLLFVWMGIAFTAQAQNANIRGFIYDNSNGEPMIFTNIYLEGTTVGATTDDNGFFSITKVQAGDYKLIVAALGFDTMRADVHVVGNEIITKKLYVNKGSIKLKEVHISAEKQEAKTEVRVSVNRIMPKEIKQLPTIGGEPELAQYLQIIPGVVSSGDQGGQMYIRGGSPIQNKVLMDGMVLYNPFHSIGLFSVFDSDIIRSADVYSGGFNAELGGRISSVIDITTRDGNKKKLSGKISANTFTSKLLLEGPIGAKTKDENKIGGGSFLFSARNSYLDRTAKSLYHYADSNGLPFSFSDYYGKISFVNKNGSKINLFGLHANDRVNYPGLSDFQWTQQGYGMNFLAIPGSSSVLIQGNFAYSDYSMILTEGDKNPRSSSISGFNGGLDFTYFLSKHSEFKYGFEGLGFSTDFEYYNIANRKLSQQQYTTEIAAYTKYKYTSNKLVIEPGMRLQYYASLSEVSLEPRIGIKYNMFDKIRIKFAGGYYSQNLISASSDRDVVNLFYGFLSGPDDLPVDHNGVQSDSRLQKSYHLISGIEIDLPFQIGLNIEPYFKKFTQLTNINRDKLFEDDMIHANKPQYQKSDYVAETGDAYGTDILLKFETGHFYYWMGYSISVVKRSDGQVEYFPHYDRRHNANIVISYHFGKNESWELGGRWNLGSGFPFTQLQGFYELVNFSQGIKTDLSTVNGQLGTQYAGLNEGRLPWYHRFDLSIKKKISFKKSSQMEIVGSISNVYNRKNIFYYNTLLDKRVNQLPILPSMGLNWSF